MIFRLALLTLGSLFSLGSVQSQVQQGEACGASENSPSCRQDFGDCSPSLYYSELPEDESEWTREMLEKLVTNTHRFALPLDGVYEALLEIDQHPTEPGILLIYSQQSETETDYGQQGTWSHELLWPDTRGASGLAFYDIHNNRPETTRITMIRSDMLFGECGTVEFGDVCEIPAFGAGRNDTSQDGKVWMPPEPVRGDIARALFYMELRYKNTDSNLTLKDCPPWQGSMGYLSQLLEWHAADEVSTEEVQRNNNACQYWQGNRNIFVDHPDLVQKFFGEPQEIEMGTRTYPSCLDIPTPSPTAELNECGALKPGDVFIYTVESDDPDGVGFLALEPIPAGLDLYMTDYPWDGEGFIQQDGEGVVKHTTPSTGYPAGENFGFGFDFGATQRWNREEGNFNIGVEGDSVILYCLLGDRSVNPLVAYSNSGEWMEPGLNASDYGSTGSAVPEQLSDVGSIVLEHLDNYEYKGPMQAEKVDLQAYMMDAENWRGSDKGLGDQSGGVMTISTVQTTWTFLALFMAFASGLH